MIFARRMGEVLYKPVVEVRLVLAGEQDNWMRRRWMEGQDSGSAFKSMCLNGWAAEEPKERYWPMDPRLEEEARRLGFVTNSPKQTKWIKPHPQPNYEMGRSLFSDDSFLLDGLHYAAPTEEHVGTYDGIQRENFAVFDWNSIDWVHVSTKQAEMIDDPRPMKFYDGISGSGKMARLKESLPYKAQLKQTPERIWVDEQTPKIPASGMMDFGRLLSFVQMMMEGWAPPVETALGSEMSSSGHNPKVEDMKMCQHEPTIEPRGLNGKRYGLGR